MSFRTELVDLVRLYRHQWAVGSPNNERKKFDADRRRSQKFNSDCYVPSGQFDTDYDGAVKAGEDILRSARKASSGKPVNPAADEKYRIVETRFSYGTGILRERYNLDAFLEKTVDNRLKYFVWVKRKYFSVVDFTLEEKLPRGCDLIASNKDLKYKSDFIFHAISALHKAFEKQGLRL